MSGDTSPRTPSARAARAAEGRYGTVRGAVRPGSTYGATRNGLTVPLPPSHNGAADASGWPLRTFLELGALPGAVPCARYHVRQVLWEWRLAAQAEPAELVVSELVTNAVTASRSASPDSPVRMWLLSDTARLLILVQDDSPHPPLRATPGAEAERGRGLLLVEAISSKWDWYVPQPGGVGKVTWAVLDMRD